MAGRNKPPAELFKVAMARSMRLLLVTLVAILASSAPAALADPTTEIVSVRSDGSDPMRDSGGCCARPYAHTISATGRFVVFASHGIFTSGDIGRNVYPAPAAPGTDWDLFVRDRLTGKTTRASLRSDGSEVNGTYFEDYGISANGRYVVFTSSGSFTRSDHDGGYPDVFVHDRKTGETTLASTPTRPIQGGFPYQGTRGSISADGRLVAFRSYSRYTRDDAGGDYDVFVRNRATHRTTRVSLAADGSEVNENSIGQSPETGRPEISADGTHVAFESDGTFTPGSGEFVPGLGSVKNVFVRDRIAGTTTRASVRTDGNGEPADSEGTAISADGQFVAFESDGAFTDDTNDGVDVFVRDMAGGTTERASVRSDGSDPLPFPSQYSYIASGNGAISGDGRYVVFGSRDLFTPQDTGDDSDVFVHDRNTGETIQASLDAQGNERNGPGGSGALGISRDGRFAPFISRLSFTPGDDGDWDVFVRGPLF